MLKFILNNNEVSTDLPAGTVLLDYVRYNQHLPGTKIGCREGDCGACTVLVGELAGDQVRYRSFTSCLTPLGNVQGKHVVTVEGINMEQLNPIQQAMVDESATQCGFCTPGFVVSLAGFCLSGKKPTAQNAVAAVDGNICRCTGYKSIERAAARVAQLLEAGEGQDPATYVAEQQILPEYFTSIKSRLRALAVDTSPNGHVLSGTLQFVGGGTDLYVQKHDQMRELATRFLFNQADLQGIVRQENRCVIGGAATVSDLAESAVMQEFFPAFRPFLRLVSSTPIRNMATVAGNFVNASPIGDLTIMFLALDAQLVLSDGHTAREIPLRQFYLGYKVLEKAPQENVTAIWFELPDAASCFHFEKVSKRTHLDIASVNSACCFTVQDGFIVKAGISAGGVGPVPMLLPKASEYLIGKEVSEGLIQKALEIAQTEISPISDVRGTETYKRLLLNQLIKAHFLALFPRLNARELLRRLSC
ncbi:[2Fe-2S]-binding domain protein [Hymenobacter roseosalivarius DSM 11622]|uniref:[2Fe-2S]-binding domain protein n=1 Tax=Hymenobacter roseosalivarius DSM 11622 TaxID=645990 RepID=A0A1W1V4B9_9BACT|nr:FAD binding domain-containing protein [Hymenobacter roseosalivarius]SMB88202.1 [2Fe-2S]-binding domain protein [Hymenobacter roseosalivarius DSM 11622]